MTDRRSLNTGIPVSLSLNSSLEKENIHPPATPNKSRILTISFFSLIIAIAISFIAKFLVALINLVTNISFYGNFSMTNASPSHNNLGWFVILIPVAGGLIVGLMALYGSKAIRGHGIPEAMEQVLTNQSRIKPTITYLKPISSAIAIGTGGPFGAEGPIIATGGALGSTFGQLLRITPNERKILLAAGATAGMSAIFGSPIAAIFLAIELLIFEFSPRSIIPIALACITGAAGHHFLFEKGPAFEIKGLIEAPSNAALLAYSGMGIIIGVLSVFVTKIVYWIEDLFERSPIHWIWWPAIGGLVVGIVGYFAPRTMGVGYENITDILSGEMSVRIILSLAFLKFISWAIALGSGTSGGTLAPLLTIGGATGALLGNLAIIIFPDAGISIPLAALTGMAALFAGASRALLTSIIFALETTHQSNSLLALLAGCTASYFVSFFLMENTIMTEKIVRRGVKTPHSYEPDILEKITVAQVVKEDNLVINSENTIGEVRDWLEREPDYKNNFFVVTNSENEFKGIVSASNLFAHHHNINEAIGSLIKRHHISIREDNDLRFAIQLMAKENIDMLPVISKSNHGMITGVLSYKDIINAYKGNLHDHVKDRPSISIKRRGLKMLVKGKRMMEIRTKI